MRRILIALGLLLAVVTPAWGAFPQVAATATTTSSAGCTSGSYTANLPSGIVAGNLLIVFFAADTNITAFSWPAGWNEFAETDQGVVVVGAAYRFADGTEGSTITITCTGTDDDGHAVAMRITGAHASTPPEVGTASTQSAAAPDCPSLNPTNWDVEDTLWICFFGEGASQTLDVAPTGYGNQVNATDAGAQASLFTMRKENAAASEDPSTMTISGSVGTVANTMAIRPSAQSQAPRSMHQYKLRRKE